MTDWRVVENTKGTRRWYTIEVRRLRRRKETWEGYSYFTGFDGYYTPTFTSVPEAMRYCVDVFSDTQHRVVERDAKWEKDYKAAMKKLGLER
jgi:hypothetical protein